MKYTIKDFRAEYPSDSACLDKIMAMRYGGTEFACPACKRPSRFHRIAKRRAYACQHCGHHVYPCVGTPFEKSRTPLSDWFFAMYLFTSTRHGVAAKEVQRQLGCTYKTAWRMCHELRKLMAQADTHDPLSGHVELDETFVGGKSTRDEPSNKTIVFGMVERQGNLRSGPVDDVSRPTLEPYIAKNIQRGSVISTDKLRSYSFLGRFGYRHGTVDHSAKQYVKGIHHVNTLENFWGQLKRSIRGTHIHASRQHMWKYTSEFTFRYNLRKQPEAMFSRLVEALSRPRLAAG